TEIFQRLHRVENVLAIGPGAAMALAHTVQLPRDAKPARILPVSAVDDVTQGLDPAFRVLVDPHRAPGFSINQGDLLAGAQILDRRCPLFRRHAVDDAAAGAAMV